MGMSEQFKYVREMTYIINGRNVTFGAMYSVDSDPAGRYILPKTESLTGWMLHYRLVMITGCADADDTCSSTVKSAGGHSWNGNQISLLTPSSGEWATKQYCLNHASEALSEQLRAFAVMHRDATTTVADDPELLAVWADDTDPASVLLNSDQEYMARCPNGHINAYSIHRMRRAAERWTGRYAEQTEPVTSKRWIKCCRDGRAFQEAARAEMLPGGTSRVELMHHAAAEAIFGAAKSGARLDNPNLSRRWSVDILVNDTIVIEYDGRRWHQAADRREVDTRKTGELLDADYTVIRLREEGLESLNILHPNYREIVVSPTNPAPSDVINAVKVQLAA